MKPTPLGSLIAVAIVLVAGTLAACSKSRPIASPTSHWIASWGASPSPVLPSDAELDKMHLRFSAQTVRELVHLSVGGSALRVRFSNVYGATALPITAASIAVKGQGGVPHPLTFGGQRAFTIPSNAVAISDPLDLTVASGSDLAINLYVAESVRGAGIHYAALQTSWAEAGDQTAAPTWPDSGTQLTSWVFLSGVDVLAPRLAGTVATFGDSITDGAHSVPSLNHRWPDILAQRLHARQDAPELGVLNAGIGGNRLLHDAAVQVNFGVNGLSRFDRDVLAQPGIRYLTVLEGINDIGHAGGSNAPISESVTGDDLIGALRQLADRAHERGIKVFGCTLTPFEGVPAKGYYSPEKEAIRQKYNAWIRTTKELDACIDFDQATRDPSHPTRFLPAYDSGDHLHPNDAGYQAMGDAIDLGIFH
jgi:lysophospholipase L1-like esterase